MSTVTAASSRRVFCDSSRGQKFNTFNNTIT
uniref:Uncharacterized protein n=1 Tax=Anguilla anguilla TaxID=7936 RepID=A0A0E9QPF1_ANGAN